MEREKRKEKGKAIPKAPQPPSIARFTSTFAVGRNLQTSPSFPSPFFRRYLWGERGRGRKSAQSHDGWTLGKKEERKEREEKVSDYFFFNKLRTEGRIQ